MRWIAAGLVWGWPSPRAPRAADFELTPAETQARRKRRDRDPRQPRPECAARHRAGRHAHRRPARRGVRVDDPLRGRRPKYVPHLRLCRIREQRRRYELGAGRTGDRFRLVLRRGSGTCSAPTSSPTRASHFARSAVTSRPTRASGSSSRPRMASARCCDIASTSTRRAMSRTGWRARPSSASCRRCWPTCADIVRPSRCCAPTQTLLLN